MGLTEALCHYNTAIIQQCSYIGIFILMTLESLIAPVPSELVMPFAGFLIAEGRFTFFGVIFFSTLGSIVGSLLSYAMGRYGGHPFVDRYGKYLLLDRHELEATERFFGKYGEWTIFISRFIPVVRHLISIPAGVARMNLWRFSVLTIIGAGLWNAFLTYVGFRLKQNWQVVMQYSHIVDIVIVAILLGLIIFYVTRQLRRKRKRA